MILSHVDRPEFASEMDPDYLPDEGPNTAAAAASPRCKRSSTESDFGFAFNDINFSDRVLRIEILPDLPSSKSDSDGCSTVADWARNRKRRREDIMMENEVTQNEEEQDINCNMPDPDDAVAYENENQDDEVVAMVEEPSVDCGVTSIEPDNEVTDQSESSSSMDYSAVLKVKNIHISSPILAVKSPFFYKLFSNGMKESDQRQVTLRIHASEEAALMELLNFIYSNSLSTVSPSALLDILMAADKYEVASCMRYCSRLLRNQPMTCESALLYLDLPSNVQMRDAVQPLTDAAKQFLAARYKDITKFQEEVLNLPLAGIEAVMSSDDLQVASEDAVFDFLLKWARVHYPKLEDRREILGTSLARLIRFPYMTCRKLRKLQICNDFDTEKAGELVLESLFFKSEPPHRQRVIIAENSSNGSSRQFVERTYRYRPVKALELVKPQQHCMVFLDLTREECMSLYPTGRIYSQAFHLGGQGFFLSAHCNMDQQSAFHCFGLFLGMQEKGSVSFAVDYEFAARSNPTADFASKYKGNYKFTGGKAVGYRNLFGMPWTAFMADDSPYFINGTLHLRADLTIRL